ncbi:Uncharacterised protein [Staphylococcus aureus]|mgnify:CR=1 FL=1|nr:hypothetical protein ERS140266_01380 [Staphylococcus schweitzeri]SGS38595.1 Uncharacterised protein [Staphylococcus aureus]SGS66360.1 Uncharacterised protein [Staphylococcus aureus]SGV22328.1 Uncharacterised protein [Staphylococcus aureus]VEE65151.1 Uncharacterised protein [Staphylococcus schweitzeri]
MKYINKTLLIHLEGIKKTLTIKTTTPINVGVWFFKGKKDII